MTISGRQNRGDDPFRVQRGHKLGWREEAKAAMNLPADDTRWGGACEAMQRGFHDFLPKFASAYAHMVATPVRERVDPREAPVTSFIFVDDPHDSNAFGHVVGKWADPETGGLADVPVVTNDVGNGGGYDYGNVRICKLGYFHANWGDETRFATTWFGSESIPTTKTPDPESPNQKARRDTRLWVRKCIANAQEVVEYMDKAIEDNKGTEHPRHELALRRERRQQLRNIEDLERLL